MTEIRDIAHLLSRLRGVLLRQRLTLLAAGLTATTATAVAVWILLSLVAGLVILPVWVKVALLIVAVGSIAYAFVRYALARLFHGGIEEIAARLEKKEPSLKGRLVAAVQFARMKTTPGYSRDLIALTERQALSMAADIDLGAAVTLHPLWQKIKVLSVAVVAALLLGIVAPGLFSYSYLVYSQPGTEIAPPLGYRVVAVPGSVEWVKYRDIEIGAAIVGDELPENAVIHHRLVGGRWQHARVDLTHTRPTATAAGDSLAAVITLRQVNKSFDYWVEAGRVRTEIQKVDVVDRPRVNGIKLSVFYPRYTGLAPEVIDENNGSFSAIVGSRVNLQVTTNLPVEHAELVFNDSSRTPLSVNDASAEVSLLVDSSRSYYVRLRDHLGEENPDPIEYYMTAIPDEYPSIDVLSPGFDVNLGDEMILPLKVRIFDDFGFSSLVLKYQIMAQDQASEEHVAVLHFSDRIKTEGDVEFNWDLDQYNLFPGDYVLYHLEIADNDQVSGPKVSATRRYVARLPSLEEIVAETEGAGARRIERTQDLLRTGRELVERLKNVSRKLQSQPKDATNTDWQMQKELSAVTEKNAELVENIEKSAAEMERSIDKMAENTLLSRKIMEKLAQIQKLFEDVATPEMKEAHRKLMEALRNMDRKELEKAASDYQMSMEELLQRLERTLALLKRLELEQKMEAMVRQMEELVKRQGAMNQQTDSTDKNQLPGLSQGEDEIKASLERIQKQVDDLDKLAQQAEMQQSEELKRFSESVQKTDAGENMEQMSNALNRQNREKAGEQGEMALSKLQETLDDMQQQLAKMTSDEEEDIERAMRAALEDANQLSKMQEELRETAADVSPLSIMLREMATSQQELMSACKGLKHRISELGKMSPFVASGLQDLVDGATSHMEMASRGFDSKKSGQALKEQREAMTNLNMAAIRLMESIQQQSNCKSGGSCDNKIKKLQSLCNKQKQLNQQTQGQCQKPGGQGNPQFDQEGRQTLQRLAGEQATIRKSMEDLAREFGNSRQILGRLDGLAEEMKRVEEDLASGETGEKTLERQLQIHSRMLEATRSLQRRDFTEQRKAESATSDAFYIPPELSSDILEDGTKLEDRLRQYLSGQYPPQYEEQIKAYFRALLQARPVNRDNSSGESTRP